MKHMMMALCACALVACGGEESGDGFNVEDYVDAELLDRAENEHQRLCVLQSSLIQLRSDECFTDSIPFDFEACFSLEMPPSDSYLSKDGCYERWATAECRSLEGPEDDVCRLAVEGYFDDQTQ